MRAVALKRRAGTQRIEGARKSSFPKFVAFCDPTLRDSTPSGPEWIYEIKTDGYRAQLHKRGRAVTVYSRRGYDWTEQFAPITKAARALKHDVVIDGEATVYGATGLPDFQALRRELGNPDSKRLILHAFDLLYLDGYDLRRARLLERKRALCEVLSGAPESLLYLDYLGEDGDTVFRHACRLGLEGVVAKRKDAPYQSGRAESWIKVKCLKSDNFPIIAFVEKLGAKPRKIASLYLGKREGGRLLYTGKARTGYTEEVAREVRERLDPLIRTKTPLDVPVKKPKATWVDPVVDAEIEYSGITDDGLLRAAVFKGLREDLGPPPRRRRSPPLIPASRGKSVHGVPRENILQLLPDAVVPSKDELAAYWRRVWKKALPYLGHRPLKLVRHVHGITFYHKGRLPPVPASVHQLRIEKREGGEGTRLWIDDLQGFLGLVEMGAVELHPWNATAADFEHADRIVIDLDPGEGVEWQRVIDAALRMRQLLKAEGLTSWPKLTGGKGIHVMAPLEQPLSHDQAHRYARALVGQLSETSPEQYIVSAQASRRGRIFLDYLRNGRGTTAIGTYSPRALNGFPIAAPVTWARIEAGIRPDAFTMKSPFRVSKQQVGTSRS
jgi:bifunctional non-homologous end joining protein LigD